MSMSQEIKKFGNHIVIQKVSEKLGISQELVKKVAMAQSLYSKKIIRQGNFEAVSYCYMGKLLPQFRRIRKINEMQGYVKQDRTVQN